MNLVIIGQKQFAVDVLDLCLSFNFKVNRIIAPCSKDRLAQRAIELGIDLLCEADHIAGNHIHTPCDLIICAYAHAYVSDEARLTARLGAVGYHPSLLPDFKGKYAIQDAIDAGVKYTGGSLYKLDSGLDTGQVLLQKQCKIENERSAFILWKNKLAPIGLKLFSQFLETVPRLK